MKITKSFETISRIIARLSAGWLIFMIISSGIEVRAQSDVPRIEVGGHISVLKLPAKGLIFDTATVGGGGRVPCWSSAFTVSVT